MITDGKFAGQVYNGDWKYGKKHGKGNVTFSNGNKYEGEFKHDTMNGFGTYTWIDEGISWTGQWRKGEPEGIGTKKVIKTG